MWPFRDASSSVPTFDVANEIGPGSRVRGDLSGPGGFRIDGAVEGSIDSDGPVVVGEHGSVEGSIRGRDIVVLGVVRGDVNASGHLEIGAKGRVVGEISVQSFRMHAGGVFRGASCMPGGEDITPLLAPAAVVKKGTVRTLPPPIGAVPPPPRLERAEMPPPGREDAMSEERIVTESGSDDSRRATGT